VLNPRNIYLDLDAKRRPVISRRAIKKYVNLKKNNVRAGKNNQLRN